MLTFSQTVNIIGVNPYVTPPENMLSEIFHQAGKESGAIPVKGKINGKEFMQTLIKFQGEWRLYINGIMRKAAGIDVGDTAYVEIEFDPKPRIEPMNELFKKALEGNTKAYKTFHSYSPSRQKEINRYLNALKSRETLGRNIRRIVAHLAGEEVDYFVLLRNKK